MKYLFSFIIAFTFILYNGFGQSITDTSALSQWVIKIEEGESIKSIMKSVGADEYKPMVIGQQKNYYLLIFKSKSLNPTEINKGLKSNTKILWSEQDRKTKIVKKNLSDPLLSDQWHLNNTSNNVDINAFEAWDLGYSGNGVQICIVDDGIQILHPDLLPRYMPTLSWDYNSNEADPSGVNGDNHGTACAGVAAAAGDNATCGAGAAYEANLSGLRLIAAGVSASTEATALTFRQDSNYIFSNSWGPSDNGQYHNAIPIQNAAMQEGTTNGREGLGSIYVWAAGNGGSTDNTNYDPYVNSIYTIGVGAHGNSGLYSSYSEPGASMLVSAPSNGGSLGITTTDLMGSDGYNTSGDCTDDFGGTSSATPLVAGVIALMLEANPLLTWRDVQHLLIENAIKIDPTHQGWANNGVGFPINHNYGFGAIDAEALVLAAIDWETVLPQISQTVENNGINQQIPDNSSGLTQNFNISGSDVTALEHIEIVLNINHNRASDLQIRLVSPRGTESVLAEQRNLTSQSFGERKFMTVRNWGEPADGTWEIIIDDLRADSTGIWESAKLILYGSEKCATPHIISQSENISPEILADTFLYVMATSSSALEYQWRKDGINIPNADDDTLHIADFSTEDMGTYTVAVFDSCQMVLSQSIEIGPICNNEAVITIQPDSYGSETSWAIFDSNEDIIFSGGPYTNGNTSPIQIQVSLCVGPYTFRIYDSYGDGICCGFGAGTYSISYLDKTITMDSNDPFTYQEEVEILFCEKDTDQDGQKDCLDLCPYDPSKIEPGLCGCGVTDQDIHLNTESISDGIYITSTNIFTDGSILTGRDVAFKASNSVLLEGDFSIEQGGLLDIQMVTCNE